MESDHDPAGRPRPFRFASDEVERYRQGRGPGQPRPLFRRWEAMGLLLLVAVGAAFAVNCVPSLEHHLAGADHAGVSQDDISEIVNLAVFIKKRAASHVERLGGVSEEEAT